MVCCRVKGLTRLLEHDDNQRCPSRALFLCGWQPAAVQRIEPLANAGGWSGSRLWRITCVGQRFLSARIHGRQGCLSLCLRRWPREHPTKERLRLIHDVLKIVAAHFADLGCPLSARSGETFVEHGGYLWELTELAAGRADSMRGLRAAAGGDDGAGQVSRAGALMNRSSGRHRRFWTASGNGRRCGQWRGGNSPLARHAAGECTR